MSLDPLLAVSPLDGRYHNKLIPLQTAVSEYALIKHRLCVEVRWLQCLAQQPDVTEVPALSDDQQHALSEILDLFDPKQAQKVKDIERTCNHDVKAVEYYLQNEFKERPCLMPLTPFIHFACTSEDINNLAYALMLKAARQDVLVPLLMQIIEQLQQRAQQHQNLAMLSRTHGQSASPTTLGKELNNVAYRLQRQITLFEGVDILGKFNGAVGNFNAHMSAYSDVNWLYVSQCFVESMGLTWNPLTTQIEPHDYVAQWMDVVARINVIIIDFNRDMWGYISQGYFKQKVFDQEVGSSTMPHKVNPIDFENSEGNLGVANALASHLARKLPISRWQRDLTDSTVLRNIGSVVGYCFLAYQATLRGLSRVAADPSALQNDLMQNWAVLAEPIQTVMRRYGITDAYEQLKALSRGQALTESMLHEWVHTLPLPEAAKASLLQLTPATYLGAAATLATWGIEHQAV